jgi:hypothetical protein
MAAVAGIAPPPAAVFKVSANLMATHAAQLGNRPRQTSELGIVLQRIDGLGVQTFLELKVLF